MNPRLKIVRELRPVDLEKLDKLLGQERTLVKLDVLPWLRRRGYKVGRGAVYRYAQALKAERGGPASALPPFHAGATWRADMRAFVQETAEGLSMERLAVLGLFAEFLAGRQRKTKRAEGK